MSDNKNLCNAYIMKNDEFYTRYEVIEFMNKRIDPAEYENKIVYCNCDWPESNFVKYYKENFHRLKLKKLIATGIFKDFDWHGTFYEYDGVNETISELNGKGEFASRECKALLDSCDIVVTNPPFSMMKKYMQTVFDSGKKYITVMSNIHLKYPNILEQIINGNMKLLVSRDENGIDFENRDKWFIKNGEPVSVLCVIVTNIDKAQETIRQYELNKKYDPAAYVKLDNHDILNVDKVSDVPYDYPGMMAIPITALCNKGALDREKFIILGKMDNYYDPWPNMGEPRINGKIKFSRLVVRLRNPDIKNKE